MLLENLFWFLKKLKDQKCMLDRITNLHECTFKLIIIKFLKNVVKNKLKYNFKVINNFL